MSKASNLDEITNTVQTLLWKLNMIKDTGMSLDQISKTYGTGNVSQNDEINHVSLGQRSLTAPTSAFINGDTAWLLFACSLVLFMTMPGLAIYYGGMVSSKNVLAMAMQIFSICCLITVLWLAFGYSLAFTPTGYYPSDETDEELYNKYLIYGNGSRLWLRGMTLNSYHSLASSIPESVYCMFQLTFAIITPSLICGSIADRMRYWPMLLFIGLWHLTVYCPIAHTMWHTNGIFFQLGTLDYAGGNVVHISSGVSGLVAALVVGNRKGWSSTSSALTIKARFSEVTPVESHPPHNILLTYMGMSMLWVGWFGFNAGSAVSAGPRAGYAMLATMIATGVASLSWMLTEVYFRKKPSVLGMINGAIAGLVCITPGCGYVDMNGAFFFGLIGGCACYFGSKLKHYIFKVDDALDAFGVHAIGGIIGGVMTGFFANPAVTGSSTIAGVFYANTDIGGHQLAYQLAGICFAIAWSAIGSFILLIVIDNTIGLRVTSTEEAEGLDNSLHDENIVDHSAAATAKKNSSNNHAHNLFSRFTNAFGIEDYYPKDNRLDKSLHGADEDMTSALHGETGEISIISNSTHNHSSNNNSISGPAGGAMAAGLMIQRIFSGKGLLTGGSNRGNESGQEETKSLADLQEKHFKKQASLNSCRDGDDE